MKLAILQVTINLFAFINCMTLSITKCTEIRNVWFYSNIFLANITKNNNTGKNLQFKKQLCPSTRCFK